jgi:hypothetical protein
MLEHIRPSLSKFDDLFIASIRFLYLVTLNATCLAIVIGLIGSLLLILYPSADDVIIRETVNGLVSKYNNLDAEQKLQIKLIFRDIFLDVK